MNKPVKNTLLLILLFNSFSLFSHFLQLVWQRAFINNNKMNLCSQVTLSLVHIFIHILELSMNSDLVIHYQTTNTFLKKYMQAQGMLTIWKQILCYTSKTSHELGSKFYNLHYSTPTRSSFLTQITLVILGPFYQISLWFYRVLLQALRCTKTKFLQSRRWNNYIYSNYRSNNKY